MVISSKHKDNISYSRTRRTSKNLLLVLSVSIIPFLLIIILGLGFERINQEGYSLIIGIILLFYFFYGCTNYIRRRHTFKDKPTAEKIDVVSFKRSLESYNRTIPNDFVLEHFIFSYTTFGYAGIFFVTLLIYHYVYVLTDYTDFARYPVDSLEEAILKNIFIVSGIVAYTSMLFYVQTRNRLHQYFLANAYLSLCIEASTSDVKLHKLFQSLDAYHVFLQKNFKIRIRDLQGFYSQLASSPIIEQQIVVEEVNESFRIGKSNLDPLATLRSIKMLMNMNHNKEFLTAIDAKIKLQSWLPFVGAFIPLVVALVQLFIPK